MNWIVLLALYLEYSSVSGVNLFRNLNSQKLGDVTVELVSASDTVTDRTKRSPALPGTLSFEFQYGGDQVLLNLEKNTNVGINTPVFLHRQGEAVPLGSTNHKTKDVAFYQDVTKGASIMVRRQEQVADMYELMGTYYLEDNQYSIEPIEPNKETQPSFSMTFNHTISILNEHLNLKDDIIKFGEYDIPLENTINRYKRQLVVDNLYTVELLMVIDHAIYQTWYNGITEANPVKRREKTIETIKQYYAFVLNGIDVRYASIQETDLQIDVTFAGILIFDDDHDSYLSPSNLLPGDLVESSDALETFRQWVLSNMTSLPPSDHVMLFTGFNLTYGGSTSNAGLAYLRSICNSEYFFSIVEEYFEFRVISIAAHELGHSLGARHDMDENTCLSFQLYIMTSRFKFPSKSKAANPYRFSKCSIQYFKDFIFSLKRHGSYCLKTRDALQDIKEISGFLINQPGEIYTPDIQCQNSQGDRSYVCREKHHGEFSSTCSQGMLCYNTDIGMCSKILPADGTPCAKTKWCINGTCVEEMSVNRLADDCPFGDIPVVVRDNQTCRHLVSSAPWECYDERFRLNCCDSCFYKHTTVAGCEFGDRQSDCIKEVCNEYNETTRSSECCETCSDVPFPTRPARTTTTTIATTTTMTTTPISTKTTLEIKTLQTTTTSANQVVTLINPNLGIAQNPMPPATTPATKMVTSKINPVTTLFDIGGVTFKSKNPDSSVLPNPEADTQNYITKGNMPVITRNITPSPGVTPKNNRHYNPPGIPPGASRDSPQGLSGTTTGSITQNEKPDVEQPSPTVTDPPRRFIQNHGTGDHRGRSSTTDKSNEINYISKPDVITSPHITLLNSKTNMDLTTTMSSILSKPITNSNMQPIWPPFINRYLTIRQVLRKKTSRNSNRGYRFHKPGGESDEDGNSSGGTSEEDSNGNGHGSWRQRFFHHLRTKINQHQEHKQQMKNRINEKSSFVNYLVYLLMSGSPKSQEESSENEDASELGTEKPDNLAQPFEVDEETNQEIPLKSPSKGYYQTDKGNYPPSVNRNPASTNLVNRSRNTRISREDELGNAVDAAFKSNRPSARETLTSPWRNNKKRATHAHRSTTDESSEAPLIPGDDTPKYSKKDVHTTRPISSFDDDSEGVLNGVLNPTSTSLVGNTAGRIPQVNKGPRTNHMTTTELPVISSKKISKRRKKVGNKRRNEGKKETITDAEVDVFTYGSCASQFLLSVYTGC